MDRIRVIVEDIITFLLKSEIISILFLVVCFGTIIAIIRAIRSKKCNCALKSLGALLGFLLAFAAYKKISRLMDTWLVLQISKECYPIENKISPNNVITPTIINGGGSASAYVELERIYQRTEDSSYLKKMIKDQLNLIYNDIERGQRYAEVEVCTNSNTQWKYKAKHSGKTCNQIERSDDFDVVNIIEQLREQTYWETRLTTAKYLKEKQYLEKIKNNKENFERLKGKDYAKIMYENLVFLIKKDASLSARKSALDTFAFWACIKEEGGSCHSNFTSNNIYNFDIEGERWRKEIIDNFNETIGLNIESKK